jgi:hypothetical protein
VPPLLMSHCRHRARAAKQALRPLGLLPVRALLL